MKVVNGVERLEIVLVDNGSYRAAPAIQLRKISQQLQLFLTEKYDMIDIVSVVSISARHSNKIDPQELSGEKVLNLIEFLENWKINRSKSLNGKVKMFFMPFFIGPSKTVSRYMRTNLDEFKGQLDENVSVLLLPHLYHKRLRNLPYSLDVILSSAISDLLKDTTKETKVFLVDHGSASREVNLMRRSIAASIRQRFGCKFQVIDCSMENPLEKSLSEAEMMNNVVNFNSPLLEDVFSHQFGFVKESHESVAIIAYLFMAEGKHAGKEGDIDEILSKVKAKYTNVQLLRTDVLGKFEAIIHLLATSVQIALKEGFGHV